MLDVAMLKNKLKTLFDGQKSDPGYAHVIETDFEHEKHKSKLDERDPNMNCYGDFQDTPDMKTCEWIAKEMEAAVREFYGSEKISWIIFPDSLFSHISEDVMRMSLAEPCGIEGCAIIIKIQEKDKSHVLKPIFGNPLKPPTFEIYLTLREDTRAWMQMQKVFITIKGCILNTQWTALPTILRSGFLLEKRRLYRGTSSVENSL